jgi:hypothetical protein
MNGTVRESDDKEGRRREERRNISVPGGVVLSTAKGGDSSASNGADASGMEGLYVADKVADKGSASAAGETRVAGDETVGAWAVGVGTVGAGTVGTGEGLGGGV